MRVPIGPRAGALVVCSAVLACSEPTRSAEDAASPATSAAASVADAKAVTECGTEIRTAGRYRVIRDLVECPSNGILILTSHVTLFLDGHEITGRGADRPSVGIFVGVGVPTGVSHISIRGPGYVRRFATGVYFERVRNSALVGMTASHNLHGFALNRDFSGDGDRVPSAHNVITGNSFVENVAHGMTINGGIDSEFRNNLSQHNGYGPFFGTGIFLFDAKRISLRNNRFINNATYGVYVPVGSRSHRIIGNHAFGNLVADLADDNERCDANLWLNNAFESASRDCIH